ncbi:MAG: rod-binding protein [Treponema sp.]|jgi:flagellar protein FlgJ|nr:rod-binding protein [Treponema sp.]
MDITALGSYLNTLEKTPFSGGSRKTGAEGVPLGGSPNGADTVFAGFLDKFRSSQAGENPSGKENTSVTAAGSGEAEKEPVPALSSRKPLIDKTDKLYEQCEALETFLVKTLISGMRNTVQKSKLIDTGFAGEMYEDMLYDEYAKDFTRNANFGLAEMAYLELTGQRGKVSADHL